MTVPRTRPERSQGLLTIEIKSRGLKCGRAGFSAWPVASKLMEVTLKSWHERKASKCNCFFVATNFQIDPRTVNICFMQCVCVHC